MSGCLSRNSLLACASPEPASFAVCAGSTASCRAWAAALIFTVLPWLRAAVSPVWRATRLNFGMGRVRTMNGGVSWTNHLREPPNVLNRRRGSICPSLCIRSNAGGYGLAESLSSDVHHRPRGWHKSRLPDVVPLFFLLHHLHNKLGELRRPSRRAASTGADRDPTPKINTYAACRPT